MRLMLVIALSTLVTWSYPVSHAPFVPGTQPNPYPVMELETRDHWSFGNLTGSHPLVRLRSDDSSVSLSIFDESGNQRFGPERVSIFSVVNHAYQSDLNRDGRPDYVLAVFSGGNGIPPWNTVFAISRDDGYEVTVFWTYDSGPMDYVDISGDGRFQYIHTAFVDALEGRDGRAHHYWVYNIYALQGSSFVQRNTLLPGFPKWIMYAGRTNHRPTSNLSVEQKKDAWRAYEERLSGCLKWPAGDACANRSH